MAYLVLQLTSNQNVHTMRWETRLANCNSNKSSLSACDQFIYIQDEQNINSGPHSELLASSSTPNGITCIMIFSVLHSLYIGWDELKLAALSSIQFVVDTALVVITYHKLLNYLVIPLLERI